MVNDSDCVIAVEMINETRTSGSRLKLAYDELGIRVNYLIKDIFSRLIVLMNYRKSRSLNTLNI